MADDPLLHCLVFLTRFWGQPQSGHALRAGLPLVDAVLTPGLFIQSAGRAGLTAGLVRKRLDAISPLTLPVVLLLENRQACLLLALDRSARTATILFPETGEGEQVVPLDELEKRHVGRVLFCRPRVRLDARADQEREPPQRSWFWGTLARFRSIYGEAVLASLMINLFTLASPLFVMNVYDRVVPNSAMETLWILAIGAGTVYLFDFLIRTLRGYFLDVAGKKADVLMAGALFRQIQSVRLAARPASTGALARNLMEFESLRDFFTSATLSVLIDLPFVFLFLWVIHALGGDLVLAPAIAAPLVLVMGALLQWPLGRVVKRTYKESSQKHAILVESLTGLETIRTVGAEGVVQGRWEQVVGLTAQSGLISRFISSLALNFSVFVQQMAVVGLVVHGVYLIQAGEMTVGALVACTILTGRALAPLSQVAGLLVRFQQSLVSLGALNGIMALAVERPAGQRFAHRAAFAGGLAFDQVSFSYPGQAGEALSGVSFRIDPGERVAIIGRMGSGKSTVLKLLLKLYDPAKGAVLADGVDLNQVDPVDLRRAIGCVDQEPLLFFGTLRENIVLGDPAAEDEALFEAARRAGVDAFVDRHPHGYERMIGEQGKGLSGGQRQAVALARALLTDPPILLLDEPTSAMDSRAEDGFKTRLAQILPGRTLILVTHKASLLSLVERLIVLEEGRLVADGPRDAVLRKLAGGGP